MLADICWKKSSLRTATTFTTTTATTVPPGCVMRWTWRLDGVLKASSDSAMAPQTWRDHTRRLTAGDFWLYLGLESVLGIYVDRPISLWDEMFIPGVLG